MKGVEDEGPDGEREKGSRSAMMTERTERPLCDRRRSPEKTGRPCSYLLLVTRDT
ncbi:hypothetical protein MBEHAL_0650 [Halarchaeum acidiphilum MH1-52-1]|uniref:Uncharacterized protein n=1 Tax=Halarchaeum acidiphilum MH1-52-1 TaxID=1261545 RepID=U2YSC0_9EURY|nr:hypothetical protein MBEHAL_0650 [Halarchaeum acidiphilum MH1-52-1]